MAKLFCVKSSQIIYPQPECLEDFEKIKDGECIVEITKPRGIKFHRKFFSLLNFAFKHWDVEEERKNFEVFRKNIIVCSGFYVEAYDIHGNIVPEAKSISFAEMDEVEFSELYNAAINVILRLVLKNYSKDDLERVCEEILHYA